MKKLMILLLVLGIASVSNAAYVLTWSADTLTLNIDETKVVTISSSTADPYGVWAMNDVSTVAEVTAVSALANAGGNAAATKDYMGYTGWWYLEAMDVSEPFTTAAGAQWSVSIKGLAEGTYNLSTDAYGTDDVLAVTVVPEPMTLVLLGLGGLFLRRRK